MESFVIRQKWKDWPLVAPLCFVTYLGRKRWLCVRLICESPWNASDFYGRSGFYSSCLRSKPVSTPPLNNLLMMFTRHHTTLLIPKERTSKLCQHGQCDAPITVKPCPNHLQHWIKKHCVLVLRQIRVKRWNTNQVWGFIRRDDTVQLFVLLWGWILQLWKVTMVLEISR